VFQFGNRKYTPTTILAALRRRWVFLVLPALCGAAAAAVFAFTLPNSYSSRTVILVVPQRVPEAYVKSTVTIPLEGRLPSLSQQVLSRTRLERIISDYNLYPEMRQTQLMEDVVERMRRSIHPQVARNSGSFSLTFGYADPQVAAKVADRLASLFIEENQRDRNVLADSTSQFLEAQLEESRRRLVELEKKLETYRRQHSGELPSQLPTNLQMSATLQTQVQAIEEAISRERDRRITVQSLIADFSAPLPVATPIPVMERSGTAVALTTAQQLDAARREFREIEGRLTSEHPDFRRARRKVTELQKKVEDERAAVAASSPETPVATATTADAARRTRLSELKAELAQLDRQIEDRTAQVQRLRAEIETYRGRIEVTPIRETEMTALTRDYATLQETYRSLLVKRQDSQLAASLERRQGGEQFKVLDHAAVPMRPDSPNRPLISLIGAALGFLLGVGLLALSELRDTSMRSPGEVLAAFSLPVVAAIPTIALAAAPKEGKRRFSRRLIAGAGTLLIIAVGSAVVFWTLEQ
jgi:polysaccharide chain length determinant protein (PEP-CTERM system associated)